MIRIKTFFLAFTVILACSAVAQSTEIHQRDSINQRDGQNEKQGWWKVYNHTGKYKGYAKDQLVEEGEYLNNKKTGVWTKYYPNGNKKHELTFANNVANGYAKIYYRSGQVQEEGVWKMNRWIGDYKYYYEDGSTQYEWSYNSSGKREGEQKYYHENGMLKYIGDWANGQEANELREYYADGSLKSIKQFDNGKIKPTETKNFVQAKEYDGNEKKFNGKPKPKTLARGTLVDGFNRIMNADGTVSKEGDFKNRKLVNGKEFIYEDGKVVKAIIYANGTRTGEETVD